MQIPPDLTKHEAYAPLVALLRDAFLKPKELAPRWGIGESHLSNLRRAQRGLPFTRLPTGAKGKGSIRYRVSEIVAAELAGTTGAVTVERVCLAVAACDFLSLEQRAAVQRQLRGALGNAARS